MGRDIISEVQEETVVEEAPVTEAKEEVQLNVIDAGVVIEDGYTEVSVSKNGNTAKYGYNFGADLDEMVNLFGAEMVFSMARSNMIVKLQAAIRPIVAKGESALEVVKSWMPGVKRAALPVDKKAAAEAFVDGASEADLEALLAKIQAKKGE